MSAKIFKAFFAKEPLLRIVSQISKPFKILVVWFFRAGVNEANRRQVLLLSITLIRIQIIQKQVRIRFPFQFVSVLDILQVCFPRTASVQAESKLNEFFFKLFRSEKILNQ